MHSALKIVVILAFATVATLSRSVLAFVALQTTLTRPLNTPAPPRSAHPRRRLRASTFLRASSTPQPSSSPSKKKKRVSDNPQRTVVYQRVVRPPPNVPRLHFLGSLVEYLQDRFELPDRLPMVYEKSLSDGSSSSSSGSDDCVVSWDSPLSPSKPDTCLQVQVVAVSTDPNEIASMAMVVVGKNNKKDQPQRSTSTMPTLLKNLFADSERQILAALDRGLEEFMKGVGSGGTVGGAHSGKNMEDAASTPSQKFAQGKDAILSEIVMDPDEISDPKKKAGSGGSPQDAVDAEILPNMGIASASVGKGKDPDTSLLSSKARASGEVPEKLSIDKKSSGTDLEDKKEQSPVGLDFAVQAAKKAAAKRGVTDKREDFAVEAARKAAKRKRAVSPSKNRASVTATTPKRSRADNLPRTSPVARSAISGRLGDKFDMTKIKPPSLNPLATGKSRAFMQTISRPEDFRKKLREKSRRARGGQDSPPVRGQELNSRESSLEKNHVESRKPAESVGPPKPPSQSINLNWKNAKEPVVGPRPGGDDEDDVTDKEQRELINAAQDALTEISDQGQEMTSEEILNDVLKFGEQKDKENKVGDGFVSGAFEKAKELLREQKRKRDERLKNDVVQKVTSEASPRAMEVPKVKVKELSQEEELRRMFEAGERLADGHITAATTPGSEMGPLSQSSEEEIDSIISSEKAVSSYGRILDDELAELEIRINKSPGEETDGPSKNPVFDIFSGPELYDPNVDPETAVNWPGALPGTSDVRLPKQLDEAVKQAKFAAGVMMKLEERECEDENGVKGCKYFLGDQELSRTQVDNLRRIAKESVEIGLIEDPVVRAAESSRLQQLLDELWNQPEERVREITSSYKDLLLSDNFAPLVRERLNQMAERDLDALRRDDDSLEERHARERALLGQVVVCAQLLLKEARALGAELEAQQLEVIRSICKVAMDPSHQTEEETAMALTDAVRDMRPLFDEAFIAYLKYAVAEEEGRLARAGTLDDPDHNQWLFVLKIVQQGVYAELERGISRYIDHISYVLRMETQAERRMLLKELIDVMPTLDVRPFVQVVDNIVGSLGDSANGEFDGYTELGEMSNKILQLNRDVKELLPEERIAIMSKDADEWAARQRERLLKARNLTKKRLEAGRETDHLDGEVEALGRRGEVERFD